MNLLHHAKAQVTAMTTTTKRDEAEAKKPATSDRPKRSKLKDELSIISTATEIQGQETMMIMKHMNLTVQGQMYRDKDEVNKVKIEKAPHQYNAEHLTEESCSHAVWPSGRDNYHEHRERDSRGRETVSTNGSILAEGNRHTEHEHRRSSSHHRDRGGNFSGAAGP